MNTELQQIFTTLPASVQATAKLMGRVWGEQEVECWKDAHADSMSRSPEWTMGTYAGGTPQIIGVELTGEQADAVDYAIDCEARRVWNEARS